MPHRVTSAQLQRLRNVRLQDIHIALAANGESAYCTIPHKPDNIHVAILLPSDMENGLLPTSGFYYPLADGRLRQIGLSECGSKPLRRPRLGLVTEDMKIIIHRKYEKWISEIVPIPPRRRRTKPSL